MGKFKDRTGEIKVMNNGMYAKIIRYRKATDLDVEFEDGYISYNKAYKEFKNGSIKNPNIIKNIRIGEVKTMKNGMKAKIIEYNNSNDIAVEFDDGYISRNRKYSCFINGEIKNNNLKNTNIKDRTGETNLMNCGLKATIIGYRTKRDIDVEFEDGYIAYSSTYRDFTTGSIKNPYVTKYLDVGVCDKPPMKNVYMYWGSMLKRCYDHNISEKHPSYIDCEVCDEWKLYSNFEKWYLDNYYEIKDVRMELDKDILIKGNKVYSPETCVFVPQYINTLFVNCRKVRGDLPIGVTIKDENKYKKYCSRLSTKNKRIHLGYFTTPEEAFNTYKEAKEQYIKQVADEYKDKIPKKLYEAMYNYKVEITD